MEAGSVVLLAIAHSHVQHMGAIWLRAGVLGTSRNCERAEGQLSSIWNSTQHCAPRPSGLGRPTRHYPALNISVNISSGRLAGLHYAAGQVGSARGLGWPCRTSALAGRTAKDEKAAIAANIAPTNLSVCTLRKRCAGRSSLSASESIAR